MLVCLFLAAAKLYLLRIGRNLQLYSLYVNVHQFNILYITNNM